MSDNFLIERIKESFRLEEAIEKYTDIDLSRARTGRSFNVRCPFHDDRSPSFTIWMDSNRWKCQAGCGPGSGDQIDLVAMALQVQLKDAIKLLAENLGLDKPLNDKKAAELQMKVKDRESDRDLVRDFKAQFDEVFHRMLALERMVEDKLNGIKSIQDLQNVGDLYHIQDYVGYLLDSMVGEGLEVQVQAFKQAKRCLNKWQI
jgi:DNA primase